MATAVVPLFVPRALTVWPPGVAVRGTVKLVDSPPPGPAVAEPTGRPEKRITTASPGAHRLAAASATTAFPGAPPAGCNVRGGAGSQLTSMNAVAARTRISRATGLVRWSG